MTSTTTADLHALAEFDFTELDEQAIREQWIYPLLMKLGYGLGTLNLVDIPLKLELQPPLRALGHRRWEVDYRPTVLGVGLWIIEAKRPDEDPLDAQHLGQAWCYATDPRVAVPLMVITSGRVLVVFDLAQEKWDEPVLSVEHSELPTRFNELEAVLGARRIADSVRSRQLTHLQRALEAQVEEEVLAQTLEEVRRLCESVRPRVRENRRQLSFKAWREHEAEWRRIVTEAGVGAFADIANGPYVPVGADIDQCVEMIRALPSERRAEALEELAAPRMMYSLRIFRLAVALRLVDDEACGKTARDVAARAVCDHALGFPDSPLDAAAHRFELALVPLAARITIGGGTAVIREVADGIRQHFDPHEYVRRDAAHGLAADSLAERAIDAGVRRVWNEQQPWEPEALDREAVRLRGIADRLGPQTALSPRQILDEHFDLWLRHPPLYPTTRNVLVNVESDLELSEDVRGFASELREQYFSDGQQRIEPEDDRAQPAQDHGN